MRFLGPVLGETPALATAEQARAHEAQQRRQQRDRRGHGERDGEDRGVGQTVEQVHAEHQKAEQGDADRRPREEHGAARSVRVPAPPPLLADARS